MPFGSLPLSLFAAAAVLLSFVLGYFLRRFIAESKIASAEKLAKDILSEAKKEADSKTRESDIEIRDRLLKERAGFEKEMRERRSEQAGLERRVQQKEEKLEKMTAHVDSKDKELRRRETKQDSIAEELRNLIVEEKQKLEKLSGLTSEKAKGMLMQRIEEEAKHELSARIKQLEEESKENAEKRSQWIVGQAIQRYAADFTVETTISAVQLPNEEMKGRIIGREGRNIRALEATTGVDFIVDDTPEAVIISGFDGVRREIARIALERLIGDGRIHPSRIEDVVKKVRRELDQTIKETGEKATIDCGVPGINPELIKLLGRLRYRTSYGQNVLKHSVEVCHLSGLMAGELNADVQLAKRAGLLHDIGKALDQNTEGGHASIGADVAKRYKESPRVLNAIGGHHEDVEAESVYTFIVAAADAISAARPGARRENIETYIKRLQKLEEIASSFKGVKSAYAVQAGREIRIMVEAEAVNDIESAQLARDAAQKVETELEYPGKIKITVIREMRVVEEAK